MALGWMTSRKIYNGYIKHAWKPKELEDWDKIWITQMNRIRNMECLFPEVSRYESILLWLIEADNQLTKSGLSTNWPRFDRTSLFRTHHVKRRGDSAYSVDDFFQTDRLDNMNLASPTPLSSAAAPSSSVPYLLPTYNLSLSHTSIHIYKTYLLSLIHSSTRIASISDIFAFRNSILSYYCSHCNSAYGDTNNRYWRDILENFFGLFSFGFNDGVIRGVHDGIVILRFMTNMVIIIDVESKLGEESQIAEKDVWMGRDSDRFRLKDGEVVVMGLKGESCSETCERLPAYSSTPSMTDSSDSDQPNVSTKKCNPQLLPLINQCQILQSLNSVTCKICKKEFSNLAPFVRDDEDADFSHHSTRSHLHSDESSITSNEAIASKSSASPDLVKLIKKSTDDSRHNKKRVKPKKSVQTNSETECVTTPWRYLNCDTKGTGRERRVCICV
ncbi:hypothetical protein BKA69DRAFT_365206 [Paraphysoderma sedebokerense]|nr:hypothetical protein BKA69DRAFT_365206 [Paraphysoderma sedebokerense]